MQHVLRLMFVFSVIGSLGGCAVTGRNPAEKRQNVDQMAHQVLTELYQHQPDARAQIKAAVGYAVFSNANVNIVFLSASGGYGVVVNNQTKRRTYMKMAAAGIGLGLGVKDFRAVFIFHDVVTLNRFIHDGWQFGGNADAAAKASDKGAALAGEMVLDNITIYQITKSGLALQATVKGTKYWQDDSLNH